MDNRVDELLKRAQNQDPTKLGFMDDSSDRESFMSSSDSGSFYGRTGSQNPYKIHLTTQES